MFEGIPLESYGMAGMLLIIAIMLVWKGAEVIKVALENKHPPAIPDATDEAEKNTAAPAAERKKGPGTATLFGMFTKKDTDVARAAHDKDVQHIKENLETLKGQIDAIEDRLEKKIDEVSDRSEKADVTLKDDLDKVRGNLAKCFDETGENSKALARIQGKLEA